MKRWSWWWALGAVLLYAGTACADPQENKEWLLFGGNNTDSTEQISPWIPIRGAQHIAIRLWSSKAAFNALTDADSTFSDSIAVFKVGFSDSMQSTNPLIAGDSVVITSTVLANVDTSTKMVGVFYPPLQEALRAPGNSSGIITWVLPLTPTLTGIAADNYGTFAPQYMRVYLTPVRRMTVTGGQSTAGKRVNGLKGLRGRAYVFRANAR
jgi:hypothetical protein